MLHITSSFLLAPLKLVESFSISELDKVYETNPRFGYKLATQHVYFGACDTLVPHDLELLLQTTQNLRCEDPRDKVYSILSITNWTTATPIVPDYGASVFNVAVVAWRAIMQEHSSKLVNLGRYRQALRIAKLLVDGLNLRHFPEMVTNSELVSRGKDGWWYSCKITHNSSTGWKLDIRSDKKYHELSYMHRYQGCLFENHGQAGLRLTLDNSEAYTYGHIQVLDDEGFLIAPLPEDTQPGDFLCCRSYDSLCLVLRPDTTKSEAFSIVGLAIVAGNGCIASEATIGPWFISISTHTMFYV